MTKFDEVMNQVHRNIGSKPRRSRVLFLHGFSTSGELLRASLAQQHFTEEFPELEPICMTAPNVKDKDYLRKFKLDWLDKLDVCATWGAGMERHLLANGQHGFTMREVAEQLKLLGGRRLPSLVRLAGAHERDETVPHPVTTNGLHTVQTR